MNKRKDFFWRKSYFIVLSLLIPILTRMFARNKEDRHCCGLVDYLGGGELTDDWKEDCLGVVPVVVFHYVSYCSFPV